MNDQNTMKKSRKTIDLDEILRTKAAPAWESLFQPSTVAAIKLAAEAEGVPPETYIELATLRQLAADNG